MAQFRFQWIPEDYLAIKVCQQLAARGTGLQATKELQVVKN